MESTTASTARGGDRREPHTLESLFGRPSGELAALYRSASEPDTILDIRGDPLTRGLRLDVGSTWPLSILKRSIERRSAEPDFVFLCKSFRPDSPRQGNGFNRIRRSPTRQLLPFRLDLGPSLLDGRTCLRIDYDLPENLRPLRRLYDELREVSPGTYIGPLCCRKRQGFTLLGWFGIDTRNQVDITATGANGHRSNDADAEPKLHFTYTFDAPPADVFPYFSEPAAIAESMRLYSRPLGRLFDSKRIVESSTPSSNGVGSVRRATFAGLPIAREAITEFDEDLLVEYELVETPVAPITNHRGRVDFTLVHGRTQVDYRLWFRSRGPFSILERSAMRYFRRLLQQCAEGVQASLTPDR